MRVRVTHDAASDLRAIKAFLSDQSTVVAERVLYQIVQVLVRLQAFPRLGHRGIVDGTLERIVPHTPYVVVYRVDDGDEDELILLRVYHGAQDRTRDDD
jgi:plasmid stabilization system protein ParE